MNSGSKTTNGRINGVVSGSDIRPSTIDNREAGVPSSNLGSLIYKWLKSQDLKTKKNNIFLGHRNVLERNFPGQVAASDHDAVDDIENLGKIVQGFGLFDFRNDRNIGILIFNHLFQAEDVVGTTHK